MNTQTSFATSLLGLAVFLAGTATASAANAPYLGTTAKYAALSTAINHGGAVTCTDGTVKGNVGSSGYVPAVVLTRCPVNGIVVAPVTTRVLTDFTHAYNQLQGDTCEHILTGTLAGVSLAPGVYCFDAAASLTGTVTLNGDSSGVWIFLVNGDLTGNTFTTTMAGGGQACNVYWSPSGATTMTTSNLKGTVVAGQAITLTGGTYTGRGLAAKAVTFTTVAVVGCGTKGQ
jgi:hypothetical protein